MKNFCIICFLLLQSFIKAQIYNFNEFKYQDLDVKGLSLSGNGRSYNSKSSDESTYFFSPEVSLFSLKNKLKKQSKIFFNFKGDIRKSNSVARNSMEVRPSIGLDAEYRTYTLPNYFHEIDINSDINYLELKSSIGNNLIKTINGDNSISFKVGKGRIEPITYIFLANFIIQDLIKDGVIEGIISQEELFNLGKELTRLSNIRAFDFRRRRKQQLKEICFYIQKNHLLEGKNQIDLFNAVNDNWFNVLYFQRETGKRQAISLTPFYNLDNYDSQYNRKNSSKGIKLGYEWLKSKAINEKNPMDMFFQLGYEYFIEENNFFDSLRKGKYQGFFSSLSFSRKYIPNSRSYHDLSINLDSDYYREKGDDYYFYNIQPVLNYRFNYLINYNLNLRFTSSINFNYNKTAITSNKTDKINTSLFIEYYFY